MGANSGTSQTASSDLSVSAAPPLPPRDKVFEHIVRDSELITVNFKVEADKGYDLVKLARMEKPNPSHKTQNDPGKDTLVASIESPADHFFNGSKDTFCTRNWSAREEAQSYA
ncbi:hypothetical protein M7I_4330 [Glarea lozoyensis 74030]|uniref:Uncharacterized protein n=1 Tax=Glarea lozoyensis (strain ATCC 74030 / MF5533) TaxID=1104152 RepID=H0ENW7_GLAL7|nr:hypothetical protein M7I_4330 [Glarea lozoyensis 74030]